MATAALSRRLRVVLIDDEGAWHALQQGLIDSGLDVHTAASASDPAMLLDTVKPDAVLIATETGHDSPVLQQYLLAAARTVPVVVLAAAANETFIASTLSAGACDVFDHQVSASLLEARLASLAEAARMRAALAVQPWGRDGLTGLLDRQGFIEAAQVMAGALRGRLSQPLILMLLDIDRFKRINDALGAMAGDEMLLEMSGRLRRCLAGMPEAVLARTAGDEFAVLLPGVHRIEAARRVAEIVLHEVQQPMRCAGVECLVGASIGLAADEAGVMLDAGSIGSLLSRAARAAAAAKSGGGRSVQQAAPQPSPADLYRLSLESDLQGALARGEMVLHYQPIVDPLNRTVSRLEALARWQRLDALVYPGEFIPIAEETGVVFDIGEWAVGQALHQVRLWRDAGIEVPGVSVNIHPHHLERAHLTQAVVEALADSGLEAHSLQLEVTETGVMRDVEGCVASLNRFRDLGVRLALDDFGTGHSSLAWLARLPIDTLKIDRSFVDALDHSAPNQAVVKSIMALATSLGLSTVAEGVETTEQYDSLHSLGCDSMQGYLYARPMPADELAQWWQSFQSGVPVLPPTIANEPGPTEAGRRAGSAFLRL